MGLIISFSSVHQCYINLFHNQAKAAAATKKAEEANCPAENPDTMDTLPMPEGIVHDAGAGDGNDAIDDEGMNEEGQEEDEVQEKGEEEQATDDDCVEDECVEPETVPFHESQPDPYPEEEQAPCEEAEEVLGAKRQPGHLRGMELEVGGEAKTEVKQPDLEPDKEDSEDEKGEVHTTKGVHKDSFWCLLM